MDVSIQDDLISGIQELIQAEQHCYKSWIGSKNEKWLKLFNRIREIRSKWLEVTFTDEENTQKWCIVKHLLSASTRFSEVGSKFLSDNNLEKSKESFEDSGEIMGMYYYLNEPENSESGGFFDNIKKGYKFVTGGKNV